MNKKEKSLSRKLNNRRKEQSISRHPRVGIGVIITKDDQVLLMKRRDAHGDETWSTVGGHLEYRESPQECAIRETQEEIGVIITDVTFLAITNDIFEVPEMHYVTIWMAGRYVSGEPVMHAEHELLAVDLFSWDALPEPLFLPFEHLLTGRCYPVLWDFSGGDGERINNL
jgi:8-oxo-dGTP diphosphatase